MLIVDNQRVDNQLVDKNYGVVVQERKSLLQPDLGGNACEYCLLSALLPSRAHARLNAILTATMAVLLALLVLPAAQAQSTATFDAASVVSTRSITLQLPTSVAVDSSGDVYIGEIGNNNIAAVVKVTAAGAASMLSTGSLTLS
ncbi:MAG: hypothetical protein ACP5FH_10475, partial [Terracidiphilus sp.]